MVEIYKPEIESFFRKDFSRKTKRYFGIEESLIQQEEAEELKLEREKEKGYSPRLKIQKYRVYIIQGAPGVFKIGASTDPEARIKDLQVGNPNPLFFVFQIVFDRACEPGLPINRRVEKSLHRRYAEKKVSGEWYALTPEDMNGIARDYGDLIVPHHMPTWK